MNIDDIYTSGSQWLKSEDLGTRSIVCEIESVGVVELPNEDKQKLEVSFIGTDKALLLNVTNARAISDLYGKDTDKWVGEEIELFVMPVQGPNGPTKGIRVKQPAAARPKAEPARKKVEIVEGSESEHARNNNPFD